MRKNWRSVNSVVVKRGDIFYADLRPVVGSEQGGVRPVLIIQNDTGNKHSPTVICAAITSKMNKAKLPTHVEIDSKRFDIVKDSVILLEQLRTIDKKRLKDKVCHLDNEIITQVNHALSVSLEVIMGDVFKKPAIVTDTHCIRLCNRIGLVHDCKDPKKVEMALWKIVPPEEGSSLCHRFVEHGREVCTARTTPHCERCVLADICEKNGVEK